MKNFVQFFEKVGDFVTRKEILNKAFKDISENERNLLDPLINEVVFLEKQMDELKQLPFIRSNPDNPSHQRKTEAAKLYKEFSQSYMNAIRILCSRLNSSESNESSPLQKTLKELKNKYE